jgi:hypothetical protein
MNGESVKEGSFSKQLIAVVGVLVVIGMAIIGYVARVEDDAIAQRREMRDEQHKANVGIAKISQELMSTMHWANERYLNDKSSIEDRLEQLEQGMKGGEPCED